MLVAACSLGMLVIGCEEPSEEPPVEYNKFYGRWIEAVSADAPASFQNDVYNDVEGSVDLGVGWLKEESNWVGYFKGGSQWYKQDFSKQHYQFTNTTYQYKTGSDPVTDDDVYNYTFTDTEITANGVTKSYTLTSKTAPVNASVSIDGSLLQWDNKWYISWSRSIHSSGN
jgi:hypothetical protein